MKLMELMGFDDMIARRMERDAGPAGIFFEEMV